MNFNIEKWFTCYEARKNKVVCQGPFKTAMEADDATPNVRVNSTLLPVYSFLPKKIQQYILQYKYNAIFRPNVSVFIDDITAKKYD